MSVLVCGERERGYWEAGGEPLSGVLPPEPGGKHLSQSSEESQDMRDGSQETRDERRETAACLLCSDPPWPRMKVIAHPDKTGERKTCSVLALWLSPEISYQSF